MPQIKVYTRLDLANPALDKPLNAQTQQMVLLLVLVPDKQLQTQVLNQLYLHTHPPYPHQVRSKLVAEESNIPALGIIHRVHKVRQFISCTKIAPLAPLSEGRV